MSERADLNSREQIQRFVRLFYAELLIDERLKPLFLGIARIDLEQHLPRIVDYWCKLLLGDTSYQRHTMNIHRDLHAKQPLTEADFKQWLTLFERTLVHHFHGDGADRAMYLARRIAANMQKALI